MKMKYYAMVGHCKMAPGLELGIGVYAYDPQTAAMTHLGDYDRELKVGAQTYDPSRKKLYVVDEFWSQAGKTGGGGNIAAYDLDPETGSLTRTSFQRTFGTNPSYLTLDKTGSYLLVTHHCTENFVTRMVKTETGYEARVEHDLCTLLLYRLDADGDIGQIVDVYEFHGHDRKGKHTFPHLHCVVPDQERNAYIVCDKGLDKLYSFKIDYAREKLVKSWEADAAPGSEPRYCSFHPEKPIFYSNCESSVDVNAYELDRETGALTLLGSGESLSPEETAPVSPSDIVAHPNGRDVYVSLRQRDLISVLETDASGGLTRKQTISCGGENPRGLCISPDGRFLLAANMQSGTVAVFAIGENGWLTPAGTIPTGGYPGNIQIIGVQAGG